MHTVRRYHEALQAQFGLRELEAHGIEGFVAGGTLQLLGPYSGSPIGTPYALQVARKEDVERARAVLDAMPGGPPPEGWEAQALPDLTRLPEGMRIACPSCRYDLLGIGDNGRCPECGEAFDLVELIVSQHGPEALDGCYDDLGERSDDQPE